MVEEDLSANEDADQQSDSPKALKRASPQSTPQHGGSTSLRSTTLEATAAPLSTGRRSPHIPVGSVCFVPFATTIVALVLANKSRLVRFLPSFDVLFARVNCTR